MLRFIVWPDAWPSDSFPFQYISCYGLSEASLSVLHPLGQFQYISCYGLSDYIDSAPGNGFKFQYISCYGLSKRCMMVLFGFLDFNTSHVTVYPRRCAGIQKRMSISIHLMLRFIENFYKMRVDRFRFQYISCYGLSRLRHILVRQLLNFNTSHVTVYPLAHTMKSWSASDFNTSHVTVYRTAPEQTIKICVISIHLMLRFIRAWIRTTFGISYFNTSHVTVYPAPGVPEYNVIINFNTSHVTVYQQAGELNPGKATFQYISCYGLSHPNRLF